ncbi:MAG: Amidinotransferase-domain-containing protein [Monoraphidium minutum]|nr:MAG: Amidinotransferase-domain-containing protein [Monoraphidium minutum]
MLSSVAALGALSGAGWSQWAPILARRGLSSMAKGEHMPLPGSADEAVLVRLPQRPYGATAELPADVAAGVPPGARVVGVLREAFAPSGAEPQELSKLVAPLGRGAVALSSGSQDDAGTLIIDTYARDAKTGAWGLKSAAVRAADFLRSQALSVALVPDVPAASAAGAGKAAGNAARVAAGGASPQSTNHVLMVAPTAFGFNEQAAQDNSFMHKGEAAAEGGSALTRQVLREFGGLYRALTEGAGVRVSLMQHAVSHGTPDAVFPNNWFSTHAAAEGGGGAAGAERTLVLYPMKCPNRAAERRPDVIGALGALQGYGRVIDMTGAERAETPHFFEGTGVLVLDRVNGVAYVSLSERAHEGLAREWVEKLGYNELVTFHSADMRGKPVYHTNVMMAVGTGVAVVCADSVSDASERRRLLSALSRHHEVVTISQGQMDALCGNVLEVRNGDGLPVMAMSSQAYNAFTPDQRRVMGRHLAGLVHAPIDTLENVGGGGVRCAIAELF